MNSVTHVYFSKNNTEKARSSCIKFFTVMSYVIVFSLIQCLLPLSVLLFHAPMQCQLTFEPETVMLLYW